MESGYIFHSTWQEIFIILFIMLQGPHSEAHNQTANARISGLLIEQPESTKLNRVTYTYSYLEYRTLAIEKV